MPDSVSGPVEFATRREFAEYIRSELDFYEMPASLFREVKLRKLWAFIRRNGASVAHFSLDHKGYSLSFEGLTEEEFKQREGAE